MIATAHEIIARRGRQSKEGVSAVAMDMIIDPKRAIVLAMLADAVKESSGLLRFFDSRLDVAETPHVMFVFAKRPREVR